MKPYYQESGITLYCGDCRVGMYEHCQETPDAILADPPYEQTSLAWDKWPDFWPHVAAGTDGRSLWCFGSLRMFAARWAEFDDWKFSQDVIWEKHNGSSFHADRFRRVHEQVAHFYRGPWESVYKSVPKTMDATKRTVRRKGRPPHMGQIGNGSYVSQDGGPRQVRSVIKVRSCHGDADNETQKPVPLLERLIHYSVPPGGMLLDLFVGSGSSLVAAKRLGIRATGFELREQQCEAAARRLSQGAIEFSE